MSETAEATVNTESAIDFVMGGSTSASFEAMEDKSHSPEAEEIDVSHVADTDNNTAEYSDVPEEFEDDTDRFEDSAEEEPTSAKASTSAKVTVDKTAGKQEESKEKAPAVVDDASLKHEIETLNKRLKDTQSAMHRATEDRSRLQKELDELKSKKENDDDWFSEEDKTRVGEIEQAIQKNDHQISELNEKAALAIWDAAAAKVKAEHPDFDEVVYDVLCAKLDAATGDPQVIALWNAEKDKSPANAYTFAKNIDDMLLMQNDPSAYRAKIRADVESEYKNNKTTQSTEITGKDGLDLLNSAEVPEREIDSGGSAVDYLFKE